jgi:hypothetical protein
MEKKEEPSRRPYAKPELRRVRLTPEESLSSGCKTLSSAGSVQIIACNNPTVCSGLDGS